jgi:hypothetical protein
MKNKEYSDTKHYGFLDYIGKINCPDIQKTNMELIDSVTFKRLQLTYPNEYGDTIKVGYDTNRGFFIVISKEVKCMMDCLFVTDSLSLNTGYITQASVINSITYIADIFQERKKIHKDNINLKI